MPDSSAAFVGDIPENYDQYLGPVLFQPYAADLVARLDSPQEVLELACGTGWARRVEPYSDDVLNWNARFFSGHLETVCDLLKALLGSLLGKGRMFTEAFNEKILLLIQQRIVDRSSAQIHPRHSFQNPLLGALTPRRATA